jgi:hypothetical protein
LSFDLHFFSLPVPFEPRALTQEAAAKLGALVARYGGPSEPDEFGYFFDLPEGGHIEFYAGKHEGAMLALRGMSEIYAAFAWDVMREMGWAILFAVDAEKQMLLTSAPAEDLGMLAELEGEIVVRVIEQPSDLSGAVSDPFESWAAWRDGIVAGGPH